MPGMTTLQLHQAEGLFVVETYDGRAYLGELERAGGTVAVYNGLQGRSPVLFDDEIASITPPANTPTSTSTSRAAAV